MSDDLEVVPTAGEMVESVPTAAEGAAEVVEVVQPVPEQVEVRVESEVVDVVKPEEGITVPEVVVEPQEIPTASEAPETTSPEVLVSTDSASKESANMERVEAHAASAVIVGLNGKEGLLARRAKRAARIERIFELKKLGRPIRNNDVQLHLHVSHVTATTYLNTLVLSGKLFAEGRGRGRTYRFL